VVRRGGKLSHLGHDHIISVGRINGFALLKQDELTDSRADLRFELASLLIDEADSRKQFDLDTRPTEEDISKTGENMHGKVLYTQTWPQSHLLIEVSGGNLEILEAKLTVSLHGQQHGLRHNITVEDFDSDGFKVQGTFSLLQSDFGIVPLSALGGGLTVQDRLEVNYAIQLSRLANPKLIQATSNQFP